MSWGRERLRGAGEGLAFALLGALVVGLLVGLLSWVFGAPGWQAWMFPAFALLGIACGLGWGLSVRLEPLDAFLGLFSLIVLTPVVIPHLLRSSDEHGNEASARGGLKTIEAAQKDFYGARGGYARTLRELEFLDPDKQEGRTIDDNLASGLKGGYRFQVRASGFACPDARETRAGTACTGREVDCKPGQDGVCLVHGKPGRFACWSGEAHPLNYGRTGLSSFFIDQGGVLRGGDISGAPGHAGLPEI